MSCNIFFLPEELNEHLTTHIQPSYQKASTREKQVPKLNLKTLLEDKEVEDPNIKSVLPQDLPEGEKKKK